LGTRGGGKNVGTSPIPQKEAILVYESLKEDIACLEKEDAAAELKVVARMKQGGTRERQTHLTEPLTPILGLSIESYLNLGRRIAGSNVLKMQKTWGGEER